MSKVAKLVSGPTVASSAVPDVTANDRALPDLAVGLGDYRVRRILKVIQLNPLQDISKLAEQVNLSGPRLSRLFKIHTGVSLGIFLDDQRLTMAASLLRTTDFRIEDITHRVGYAQAPSFVRAFKKKFRCSPGKYRIKYRTLLEGEISMEEKTLLLSVWNSRNAKTT